MLIVILYVILYNKVVNKIVLSVIHLNIFISNHIRGMKIRTNSVLLEFVFPYIYFIK